MSLFRLPALALAAAVAYIATVPAGAATVVEFYHRGLDHYFVSGLPTEIEALDSGRLAGWARTGLSFETFAPGDSRLAGSAPVCRFLGNPTRGLTSHFYSAFVDECATVKTRWPEEWRLETDELFRVHLVNPTTGQCPAGTKAVHRLWNRRADANHRYTTERAVVDAMILKGYVAEGMGSPQLPVAFCAADVAPAPPPSGTPACTIAPSALVPVVGTPVTLTATCSNAPTTFAWSSCTPSGSTCVASATSPGRLGYTLVASNALGAGAQARIELDWQLPSSALPACTIVASTATPQLGSALTLTANCSQTPSQFQWMGCSALLIEVCNLLSECPTASSTCRPIGAQSGPVVYALVARNSVGASPKASIGIDWLGGGGSPPPPPSPTPTCVISPSSVSPAINTTLTLTASCTNNATAFTWSGCSSTSSTCTTTEATAVTRNYGVTAQNAAGVGFPAQVSVTWQSPPTAPPVCTVAASTSSAYVGGAVTLTANCTQSPTSWQWTNCSSSTSTCTATSSTAGAATYSVIASNQFGPGSAASTTLSWQAAPPPGADLCGSYSDVMRVDLPWGGIVDTRDWGGLRSGTVIAARMRVPAGASSLQHLGQVRFYEYVDAPADRQLTVSTSACDFRGFVAGSASRTDPTSASAPIAWSNDQTPALMFEVNAGNAPVRLQPGQTYYFNLRNVNWASGVNSCQGATCNGRFQVVAPN